jgi:hypothetical protein
MNSCNSHYWNWNKNGNSSPSKTLQADFWDAGTEPRTWPKITLRSWRNEKTQKSRTWGRRAGLEARGAINTYRKTQNNGETGNSWLLTIRKFYPTNIAEYSTKTLLLPVSPLYWSTEETDLSCLLSPCWSICNNALLFTKNDDIVFGFYACQAFIHCSLLLLALLSCPEVSLLSYSSEPPFL